MADSENLENMVQELRRGLLVLAVLSQLTRQQYGYALLKLLANRGMEIDQGTLYPLLRRLEAQGMLESSWNVEAGRPRRYYVISSEGRKLLPRLKNEWTGMVAAMDGLLKQ
jgi:DNA-binding PadR family transcriptional regulator